MKKRRSFDIKPDNNKKNRNIVLTAAALHIAVFLAVMAVSCKVAWHFRPSQAMAKESFSGIGKIVEEHGEEHPYIILDIVPSEARWSISQPGDDSDTGSQNPDDPGSDNQNPGDSGSDSSEDDGDHDNAVLTNFSFTTAAMGYLAGGKAPFADDLERAFTGNPVFLHAAGRNDLVSLLIPEVSDFPEITYEEAYGGVHHVSAADGWTLLFANQNAATDDEGRTDVSSLHKERMSEGVFYGVFEPYAEGDRTGYDFVSYDSADKADKNEPALTGSKFVYVWYEDHYITVTLDQLAGFPAGTPVFQVTGAQEVIFGKQGLEGCSADDYVYRYDEAEEAFFVEDKAGIVFGQNSDGEGAVSDAGNQTPDVPDMPGQPTKPIPELPEAPENPVEPEPEPEPAPENPAEPGQPEPEATENPAEPGQPEPTTENPAEPEQSELERHTVSGNGWRRLVQDDLQTGEIPAAPAAPDAETIPSGSMGQSRPAILGEPTEPAHPFKGEDEAADPAEDGDEAADVTGAGNETAKTYYILTALEIIGEVGEDGLLNYFPAGSDTDDTMEDEATGGTEETGPPADSAATYDAHKFIYIGSGMGDYKLTETGDTDDLLIGVYNVPLYFRCRTSNDWLKQYVFSSLVGGDNASGSFGVEVRSVRADEITTDMVYGADLIYMESGQNMFFDPSLTVSYIRHVEGGPFLEGRNDMGGEVAGAILHRAADELMPVIVDYAITEEEDTEKYAGTNYQLLAKALLKRDLAGFCEAMDDGENLVANLRMNLETGSVHENNSEFPDKDDNGYNYVNQNVYVVNHEPLVSSDFAEYFDDFKANAGFGEVLAAIGMENTMLAEGDRIDPAVSKARAVQYIINFSVGIMGEFDDLSILELQPTANIDPVSGTVFSDLYLYREEDGSEGTKLYWKNSSMETGRQILYSGKPFGVTTDVKSVAEFNGEWEDINGTYDMIFIGLDGRNLNFGNDSPGRPVYNHDKLNGKVYHSGDDSGVGTYDGNDITAQKMMDLLEYLQAGYPVVVENGCFRKGTAREASGDSIDTRYIGEDTWMYKFLSAAVSDEKYSGSIFTVSDTMSSAMFRARMKTDRPRIEAIVEDHPGENEELSAGVTSGLTADMVQRIVPDENNEYHGRIAYRVSDNRGGEYPGATVVRLYADMNYDGIFGAAEELTEGCIHEGNVIDVTFHGTGPGIIPWKLEVSDTGNAYRRDSVQGYFELPGPDEEEIRVLQVTAQKGNFSVDLEAMYKKKEDSVLTHYLKAAEENTNLDFDFETITPDMLNTRLEENDQYLNQWDIVVMTVDDGITMDAAAFAAYINEGRSLLVCSQNQDQNSAGLMPESLGWSEDRRTFVSLGADGAGGLPRYAGLDSSMYLPQHGNLKAEKINEGIILRYPYRIDGASFDLGDTEGGLRASGYLLDFEDNLKSNPAQVYVTAWLTFGGSSQTAYGISPRDARNNYYCYSRGSVVCLAQSEYPYTYDGNGLPEGRAGSDECRLFVNALMAAYSAGIHGPEVSMVSGFAQTSAPVKSISVPFDQEWRDTADDETKGILDNTVDVYFKFADSNIGTGKNVKISFYYEDPEGSRTFADGGRQVQATQFGSEVWTVTDHRLVPAGASEPSSSGMSGLVPGKVYQIKAPAVSLRTLADDRTNSTGIYVLVESEFTRNGKVYTAEGFGKVSLNRASLFLLE